MTKGLVILSGGQDSTTCLYWAKKAFNIVEAITFVYGQRHVKEVDAAKFICKKENIVLKVVDISFFGDFSYSALTNIKEDVNKKKKGLPASFVPNRNALFITLAHAWAQKIKADFLVGGMCETDYSGYPDCRLEFIGKLEHTLNKGSNARICIETPLMNLDKAATFALADKMEILEDIVEYTVTCYNSEIEQPRNDWGYGCGSCPACLLRKKGYENYLELNK